MLKKLKIKYNSFIAMLRNAKPFYYEYLEYGAIHRLSHGNYMLYKRIAKHILTFKEYTVIDVGASDGWFARIIYHFSPHVHIVSFEPLKNEEILSGLNQLKEKYSTFEYHNLGVGSEEGTLELKEYGGSGLSSLSEIVNESYSLKGFDVSLVKKQQVKIITLDTFLKDSSKKLILKIDTQGFEMEVLKGCKRLFEENHIDCVIIELATIKKYEGQPLFYEFLKFFEERDFILFDLYPFYYETNGPLTEIDSVFVKRNSKLYNNLYDNKLKI